MTDIWHIFISLRKFNINDKGTRDYTDTEYARKIISQVF